MDIYFIVKSWRYLIIIGSFLGFLKDDLLLLEEFELAEEIEYIESTVGDWFLTLDNKLFIEKINLEEIDFQNLTTDELVKTLGLTEDSFDFLTFDFSGCYYGLFRLKGKISNLKASLKSKTIDLELITVVEKQVLDFIELLKPFL